MPVIQEFIARYSKGFDFYDEAGRIAAQLIEGFLQGEGIRSIVTSRAKSLTRLEAKVRQRAPKKDYLTPEDIYKDIVDLAGVRIALYFPGEREQVEKHIHRVMSDIKCSKFPDPDEPPDPNKQPRYPGYKERFSGYFATHYRGRLQEGLLRGSQRRYTEARIEVQVASVLMHAWSEVEHDLVYKPLQGQLSEEEYSVLDELNGLVLAGEIALERLQRAGQIRVTSTKGNFANHYELAAFLLARTVSIAHPTAADYGLGAVDLLFDFLAQLGLATPDSVGSYLSVLDADLEKRPLSEQIVDQLLAQDGSRYSLFDAIKNSRQGHRRSDEPHRALGFFMTQWIAFEREIRGRLWDNAERGPPVPSPALLEERRLISKATREQLEPIRRLRNDVVHGVFPGDASLLKDAGERLQKIVTEIAVQPK